ncbi:polyprenyl synthetase family protein [Nocardioides aquaticus]|nr:polyprenyl synthetase family protein [Nocardioides aquaticus]
MPRPRMAVRPRDLDPSAMAAVDALLRAHVAGRGRALAEVGPELGPVVDVLDDAVSGGKRLRAAFCLWGARAATGGDLVDGAVEAAAALELFHLAALVHDDVMDRSDDRRGRPTVHRAFADHHVAGGLGGDPAAYGSAVAVLVGDLCLTWSDDLAAEAVARAGAEGPAARAVWSRMRDQVLAGQYLDVLSHSRGISSAATSVRVLRYKSAKYTVEHPLALGATLGGAGHDVLDALASFGLAVGEAFQLRDDVLGVFGDPAVTGKPVVDDVREGKRTLLVAWAEEGASPGQRAALRRHLGDPEVDADGLAEVREVLVDTGALARVEARITELVGAAAADLATVPLDDGSRAALDGLSSACAWRAA